MAYGKGLSTSEVAACTKALEMSKTDKTRGSGGSEFHGAKKGKSKKY